METAAQIATRLRAEHPTISVIENGQARTLEPAEYEAQIAAWVAAALTAQDEAAAEEERRTLRRQIRLALAALEADATRLEDTATALSAQQIRNHLARTDRVLVGLIRVLIDRALVEDEATPARVSGAAGRTP